MAAIKVAAICGSLRKGSFNHGLIRAAIQMSKEDVDGIEIEYVDISELPMINADLEVAGTYPPVVEDFRHKVLGADAIFFASPDSGAPSIITLSLTLHQYFDKSTSFQLVNKLFSKAPLKNALDWASRPPNCWADKAAAIVSAAGGSGGVRSQYHLRQIGVFLDLHFINKPELFLLAFAPPPKFNHATGDLIDPQTKEKLKDVLISLRNFSRRLKAGKSEN